MKFLSLCLLLAVLIQPFVGCAASKEEEEFFYRGWIWPRSRDDDYYRKPGGGYHYGEEG